jgi:hypothetical protein
MPIISLRRSFACAAGHPKHRRGADVHHRLRVRCCNGSRRMTAPARHCIRSQRVPTGQAKHRMVAGHRRRQRLIFFWFFFNHGGCNHTTAELVALAQRSPRSQSPSRHGEADWGERGDGSCGTDPPCRSRSAALVLAMKNLPVQQNQLVRGLSRLSAEPSLRVDFCHCPRKSAVKRFRLRGKPLHCDGGLRFIEKLRHARP